MNSTLVELRQAAIANGLRQCRLFADCPPAVIEKISCLTSVRAVNAGSDLFGERTPVCGFFIVQHGAIKLHRVTASGRQHVIHFFRPYESLGEETLVSATGYAATATATEASQVFMVEKAGFLEMMRKDSELTLSLLRSLSMQVELLVGRLDELTLKDVPTRVADWLLHRCADPSSRLPQTVHVPESKRLLASELGTSSETLSRTLARFRDQRLLRVQGRAVTLLCPARLAQSVHGDDGNRSLRPSGQRVPVPADLRAGVRSPVPPPPPARPSYACSARAAAW